MLMEAVGSLTESGARVDWVEPDTAPGSPRVDAILDLDLGTAQARFAVEEKQRPPYPNEVPGLDGNRHRLAEVGAPMLVVPFVSEPLARTLTSAGWSWADGCGNFDLRAEGVIVRQRSTTVAPQPKATLLPRGAGSNGIIRSLIRSSEGEDEEPGATSLAAQAKVSQPRASQVLRQLLDLGLVRRTASRRWVPDREALLDRFLAEYSGPGGSEQYFYSLDPPTEVARRAGLARRDQHRLAVSADVGPDLMVGWRRPSIVILYSEQLLDPAGLGLVSAMAREDANVIMRRPADTSVFPTPELVAELNGVELPLADITQQMWDLHDLGGADRLEAAGMVRQWLLGRP